jgi:hypothetical protein
VARRACAGTAEYAGLAVLVTTCMLAGAGAGLTAGAPAQTVEQLEASIVITFARFIEWPPQTFAFAAAPIVVGVVADEGVALALEVGSRDKLVAGRALAIKRLQWDSPATGVHILLVGDSEKRHLKAVLEGVRSQPIVTVSRLPEFGRSGGMITLTFTDGRITFAVNASATTRGTVRLSSFLLSHATAVSDDVPAGVRR